jgi:uncharacterized protein
MENRRPTNQETGLMSMKWARILRVIKAVVAISALLGPLACSAPEKAADANPAVTEASKEGRLVEVARLLDEGADVNARGEYGKTVLMLAAGKGQLAATKLLLDRGADANARADGGGTALMDAAWRGHLEVAKLLLDRGADVNVREKWGMTALMLTACKDHKRRLEVVRLLKERGAKATLADASCLGDIEEVQRLIREGSDVNARGCWGMSPLMSAAEKGHLELVKLLVDKGADINTKTKKIGPALTLALDNGRLEVAKLLIAKGADVNPRMHPLYRKVPLEIARTKGYKEIEDLLKARGAKEYE